MRTLYKHLKGLIKRYIAQKLNSKYENPSSSALKPTILSTEKAVDLIISNKYSMSRFGDGDFEVCMGRAIDYQCASKELSFKLLDILQKNQEGLLVGIPDAFGDLREFSISQDMNNLIGREFWRSYLTTKSKRFKLYSIFNMNKIYIDSFISRPYMDYVDKDKSAARFENLKRIWKGRDVVFVEGELSRLGVGNDLFDGAKSIKRVLCPAKNAFSKYNDIFNECCKQDNNVLFIIALGPTATLLASELHAAGFQALDIGHIDIEYVWMKKKANKKIAVENKYTTEVSQGGRDISKLSAFHDDNYLSEVIAKIT